MAASISQTFSKKSIPVALAAGTHTWFPTPESEAFQEDVVAIMREHAITRLDTSRSYVRPPDRLPLLAAFHRLFALDPNVIEIFRGWVLPKSH